MPSPPDRRRQHAADPSLGHDRLGFTPDINALVAIVLALTTGLCLIAAHYLMPLEADARAG
jgi:hypothetical protein